jgi:hypothetical protein
MISESITDDGVPTRARALARVLILAGGCTAVVQVVRLVLFGLRPLSIAVGLQDPELVEGAIRVLAAVSMWGLVSLMPAAGGLALRARSAWARPLVVCGTVATLLPLFSSAVVQDALATRAWPGVITIVELVASLAIPLVAAVVLVLVERSWAPPARTGRWLVAALLVLGLYGTLVRVDDPVVQRVVEKAREQQPKRPFAWRTGAAAEKARIAPSRPRPTGTARLVIVPTLDGRPFDGFDHMPAKVFLYPTNPEDSTLMPDGVAVAGSAIELGALPAGDYQPRVLLDLEQGNAFTKPGNCESRWGNTNRVVAALANDRTTTVDLPMECAIRLLTPEDTGTKLSQQPPTLPSPVTFTWKPVPRAVRYHHSVVEVDSDGRHVAAEGDTTGTTWSPRLDPSPPRAHYELTLSAIAEHGPLGHLDVTTGSPDSPGSNEMSWYAFRLPGGDPQPGGKGCLEIVPTYDGQPLDPKLDLPVEVTLGASGGKEHRKVESRLVHGQLEFADLPTDVYHVFFALDPTQATLPLKESADLLYVTHSPELRVLRDGERVTKEIALRRLIAFDPPCSLGTPLAIRTPVTIKWKGVEGATSYTVTVNSSMPSPDGLPFRLEKSTVAPTFTADLTPTEPKGFYFFQATAQGQHAPIAEGGCRFTVE